MGKRLDAGERPVKVAEGREFRLGPLPAAPEVRGVGWPAGRLCAYFPQPEIGPLLLQVALTVRQQKLARFIFHKGIRPP